ncbi:hypothetical protein [Chitinophaga sp. Cy-1792]|uniref:hypothetical protein n=1 Tax=Chitinophaga sp. Cy-1792 TaxID=2608339 RepID=UPI001422B006|nr:hypothetical protein [Chitinophaga sp. Cy-1792]NIG54165.1 hypothetical protein [Chitinophaga sp. Cy-1792]
MKIISRYLVILLAVMSWGCSAEMARDGSFTLNPNQSQNATGTLKDNNNSCMPYATTGTFATATTLNGSTTYITANVNVTVPGMYTISTDRQNGVVFSATGVFTATGTQTVRLVPNGTFQTATGTDYTLSYGGTSCPIHIAVTAGTGTGTDPGTGTGTDPGTGTGTDPGSSQNGSINLVIGGKTYTGNSASATIDNSTGTSILVVGASSSTYAFAFTSLASSIKVGSYSTTGNMLAQFSLTNMSGPLYSTTFVSNGAVTTLTVTSVANKVLTGTFSGKTIDFSTQQAVTISGSITAIIE